MLLQEKKVSLKVEPTQRKQNSAMKSLNPNDVIWKLDQAIPEVTPGLFCYRNGQTPFIFKRLWCIFHPLQPKKS